MTSDKAWRTEGGRRSDMVREERQENGNPRCKSVRCALAEERGPKGEVRWMLWSEGTSRKQTKTESRKEASTPLTAEETPRASPLHVERRLPESI